MSAKPAHIHLKAGGTPYAQHVPVPIPLHWKEEVKQSLNEVITNNIIEPVPIGEPVEWCSKTIVVPKKDGQRQRTIDLQQLNEPCQRQTHHCQSPFKLVYQVPPIMKKTLLDTVDGCHVIPQDKASNPLTTFINEWNRYHCTRLLQGYISAGDA